MPLNENLKTLYQSYPESKFLYQVVRISHSTFPTKSLYRGTGFGDSLFLRLGGSSFRAYASEFTIAEPNNEANANSRVSLSFGVSALVEINEVVDAIEADAIKFLEPIEVTYYTYHSDDIYIGPSTDPIKYYVESITMDPSTGASLKLTTTNNLQFGTGRIYSITDFPGLITNG